MTRTILTAAVFTLGATAALARPPENALPLSEILAAIEAEPNFGYFDEIDWDNDDGGHWDIEYYLTDGTEVNIEVDPVTGERR
ncbi:PepSY domain-containing protein [Rubellimicrobium sp. CFH 75288]|uniref:PepSY domain-containing protein n=1 Tax=Rubellimicrobium sp. CFH 75288 TaxID=2697034 RepID=UPI001412CB4E|nr:PepSY domain-containing protein [Rubellimicrobium sp. CFH 75288]NAZ36823.1 PepSY domain-containing protein [Rubellimicrobium sp. CFH 75288]